ncbi:MAG: 50S ribosomal protein L11 methyltransferase [Clostridia bacterium]|nr:50S ribosomal protein L11 methyltransferase [Clostridia bacterium]
MEPTAWCEVRLTVPLAQSETACAIAAMAAPGGFYLEDYSDLEQQAQAIAHVDLIDEDLLQKDRTRAVIHLYISPDVNPTESLDFLRGRLAENRIDARIDVGSVRQEDWADNWKQYFQPLPVGEKLIICPTWRPDPDVGGRLPLRIDPGLAFGTGGHETTRLVLEALERAVRPGCRLLDVGCGSGILSIAALLLGAADATGVDIDPTAVRTAVENGALNGFTAPRYRMITGNLADAVHGCFDVIVANIVADAVVALTPTAVRLLAPQGVYIVSGIIDTREDGVQQALAQNGLTVVRRDVRNGWVCLTCARRGRES